MIGFNLALVRREVNPRPGSDTPVLLDWSVLLPACAPPGKSILDLLIGRDRVSELIPLDHAEVKRELLGAARRKAPPGSALPGALSSGERAAHEVARC